MNKYPHLFSPLEIRGKVFRNRIFSAPNMLFQVVNGRPTDGYVGYLEHKAKGGAAAVTLGEAAICEGARHTPPMLTTPENMNIYGEMSMAIHEHGALACVELSHGGRSARPWYNNAQLKGPNTEITEAGFYVVGMTKEDMEEVCEAFADAAEYWLNAGWDIAHIHAGHSWLFPQFLSPIINKRSDEFGGSLENRIRFPLMCLKRMRERVGDRMLISMRVSGSERCEGGFTPEDVAYFLQQSEPYVDFAEITTERWEYCMPSTYMPRSTNVELAAAIKASGLVRMPIFVLGSILEPEEAEEIIASGKADGVSMSRALIADPCLPNKARAGCPEDIVPCLRCLECTMNDNKYRRFACSVNPTTAHETRRGFSEDNGKALRKKNVVIIGGGPAGMQAAITAAARGHDVTLIEKEKALGGILRYTDNDSLKHDLRRFKNYLVCQVEKSGAKVMLDTLADEELLEKLAPDHVIVATGSSPKLPSFLKGYELARPVTDAYYYPESIKGENVVIIGGGLSGVEAALFLRTLGKNVTVLDNDRILRDAGMTYRRGIEYTLERLAPVEMHSFVQCREISDKGVKYIDEGEEKLAPADTVFYCIGQSGNRELYYKIANKFPFVDLIGDGLKVANVGNATQSGYSAAMDIGSF